MTLLLFLFFIQQHDRSNNIHDHFAPSLLDPDYIYITITGSHSDYIQIHTPKSGGGFKSLLRVNNTVNETYSYIVTYKNSTGSHYKELVLDPLETRTFATADFFGSDAPSMVGATANISQILRFDREDSPSTIIPSVSRPSQFWHLGAGDWEREFDSIALVNIDTVPVSCVVRHFDPQGKLLGSRTLFTDLTWGQKWMTTLGGPGIMDFTNTKDSYFEIETTGLVLLMGLRSNQNQDRLWYNTPAYVYSELPTIELLETNDAKTDEGRLIIGYRARGFQSIRLEARSKSRTFIIGTLPFPREDLGLDFIFDGITDDVEYELQLIGPGGLVKSGKQTYKFPTGKQAHQPKVPAWQATDRDCEPAILPLNFVIERNGVLTH